MRLVTYRKNGAMSVGRLEGERVVDLSAAFADMKALLSAGADGMKQAAQQTGAEVLVSEVELWSPVPVPGKILAIGLNYKDHFEEMKSMGREMKRPETPMMFNKPATSVTGPFAPVLLPPESPYVDYEAELGVVIGRRCRRVPQSRAWEVVAGSVIADDVSVRDWQMRSPTMTMGKGWDTHCPMGPALTTLDETHPAELDFRLWVNGDERQNSNTREMIFDIPAIIEHVSAMCTLEPGDILLTGTCAGVAASNPKGGFLKDGDVVRIEFEGLGHIENKMVAEKAETIIE